MSQGFEEMKGVELSSTQVRLVLEELHARLGLNDQTEEAAQVDDNLIADISEATGLPISVVCEAVEAVQREDRESQVSRVLRELEEPLHRVERPGHAANDPMSRHFPWANKALTSTILDDVKRMDGPRKVVVERKEAPHEKALNWLAVIVFALVSGIGIIAILVGILTR